MNLLNSILRPTLTAAMAVIVANCNEGCGPIPEPVGSLDRLYLEETRKCVQEAKSLEDSQRCRANVNWRYGLCPSSDMTILCPWGLP